MEKLENGRHTREETPAAPPVEAPVAARTGQTIATLDATNVTLTSCTALAVNAQQAALAQSTALALVAGQQAQVTDGGSLVQVAGQDFHLTNGGAAVMAAGRDATVTNGGVGILLASRNLTVRVPEGTHQFTALAAGSDVTVQNGAVGVVFAANVHVEQARVVIDVTPQRIVDAAMTLAMLPFVLFDMVRGQRGQEGETSPERA